MVYEESIRCGKVLGIAVPIPPPEVADDESSRVYIKFGTTADATKCREMMDGRMFDDNKVSQVADGSRAEVGHLVTSLHCLSSFSGGSTPACWIVYCHFRRHAVGARKLRVDCWPPLHLV